MTIPMKVLKSQPYAQPDVQKNKQVNSPNDAICVVSKSDDTKTTVYAKYIQNISISSVKSRIVVL